MKLQVERLVKQAGEAGVTLELTDKALDALAAEGYNPVYGARPMKRVLQQRVANLLAAELLEGTRESALATPE